MRDVSIDAVVLCDDVRKEVTNKDILIGAYGGGIMVPSFPVSLPMAVWIECTPEKTGALELDVRIKLPDASAEYTMRMVLQARAAGEPASLHTPQLICPISGPGILEIFLKSSNESDWSLIKTKKIQLEPGAVAQPPGEIHRDVSPAPRRGGKRSGAAA